MVKHNEQITLKAHIKHYRNLCQPNCDSSGMNPGRFIAPLQKPCFPYVALCCCFLMKCLFRAWSKTVSLGCQALLGQPNSNKPTVWMCFFSNISHLPSIQRCLPLKLSDDSILGPHLLLQHHATPLDEPGCGVSATVVGRRRHHKSKHLEPYSTVGYRAAGVHGVIKHRSSQKMPNMTQKLQKNFAKPKKIHENPKKT